MKTFEKPSTLNLFHTSQPSDLRFVTGQGAYLIDEHGRHYLDLISGLWCCALGHNHPVFVPALQKQLERITHLHHTLLSDEIELACRRLGSVLPSWLDRVIWLNTGSEAVELSLKVARVANGDDGIVIWERGYYGATNLASSLTNPEPDDWRSHRVWRVPAPDCRHCGLGMNYPDCSFECLDRTFEKMTHATAVLYEPVIASGGVIVPPPGYGRRVQEWARQIEAVFILEEVTTGMGRTGSWFGFQHDDLEPDILVLGKVLGNGLPVAAVVTTSGIEARCGGRLKHIQSHQNDPWSGAVASVVIDIIRAGNLVERSAELGAFFLQGLADIVDRYEEAVDARGLGLMAALELQSAEIGRFLHGYLLSESIIVEYKEAQNALRFFPAYIFEREELEKTLNILETGLRKAGPLRFGRTV
jgi:2,2-dialkylglycine decarboxylase (pyruvate)